eukprot:TRINITY_DN17749_c0_g2_i1.p1 TRINITY_DN17749_c0_g2~~TRINITY_DN17749_c0_g2_i1.p1  ORF type:complete len:539 (+),score=84.38 TRINITY_DN17749_c0_g2_i1:109-1725(+)
MGNMASVALNTGEAISICQQAHMWLRNETWSKREYDIGLQSMRIDILNTVREEMRDQVTVIISSLDNLMVVSTLMLSIGFGFAVEGTFPAAERDYDYDEFQLYILIVYAVLCALALVFPLASLMLTIAARFEVEMCQQDVMGDLQRHLLKALMEESGRSCQTGDCKGHSSKASLLRRPAVSAPTSLSQACVQHSRHGSAELQSRFEAVKRFPSQAKERLTKKIGSLFFSDRVGQIADSDLPVIADSLLQKVTHYHRLYPIAQMCLWMGIVCSVLTNCLLLGLYFKANFPTTVWMWRFYSGILGLCAVGSVVFLIWMKSYMLQSPVAQKKPVECEDPAASDTEAVLQLRGEAIETLRTRKRTSGMHYDRSRFPKDYTDTSDEEASIARRPTLGNCLKEPLLAAWSGMSAPSRKPSRRRIERRNDRSVCSAATAAEAGSRGVRHDNSSPSSSRVSDGSASVDARFVACDHLQVAEGAVPNDQHFESAVEEMDPWWPRYSSDGPPEERVAPPSADTVPKPNFSSRLVSPTLKSAPKKRAVE